MSTSAKSKHALRLRRPHRVRKKVSGTADRPRLAVYRSNKHITAQVIDDRTGRTLAAASTVEKERRTGGGTGNKAPGVTKVVFDRGGFLYHGRVAAVGDAAREAGMEF